MENTNQKNCESFLKESKISKDSERKSGNQIVSRKTRQGFKETLRKIKQNEFTVEVL